MQYVCRLFLIFIALTSTAFAGFDDNRKGFFIEYDQEVFKQNYKVGDQVTITGSICAAKLKEDGKTKCYHYSDKNTEINAYFPDSLSKVTDQLVLTKGHKNKTNFSLNVTVQPGFSANQFRLSIHGKKYKNTNKLLRIKAKIQKRLIFLNDHLLKYQAHHKPQKRIDYVTKLIASLEETMDAIDRGIALRPDGYARLEMPLRVNGQTRARFLSSSLFSGNRISFASPKLGMQGQSSFLNVVVTNLDTKDLAFPSFHGEEGEKHKHQKEDHKEFRLSFEVDGQIIKEEVAPELKFPDQEWYRYTPARLADDLHLRASIVGLNIHEEKEKEKDNDDKKKHKSHHEDHREKPTLYSLLNFIYPVAPDTIAPVATLEPLPKQYVKAAPSISGQITDALGAINADSISLLVNGVESKAQALLSILGDGLIQVNLASQPVPDGSYSIELSASDYGNNLSNTAQVSFIKDSVPPVIELSSLENFSTNNPKYTLKASALDANFEKVEIYHNTTLLKTVLNPGVNEVINLKEGLNAIKIIAFDKAANSSEAQLSNINLDSIPPVLNISSPIAGTLLNSKNVFVKVTSNEEISAASINGLGAVIDSSKKSFELSIQSLNEGLFNIEIKASDLAGNETLIATSVNIDTIAPNISLTGSQGILTNSSSYSFNYEIFDNSSINNKIFLNDSLVSQNSQKVGFESLTLLLGDNTIKLESTDAAGNVSSKSLSGIKLDTVLPDASFAYLPLIANPNEAININASASYDASGIKKYSLYEGATLLKESTQATFSISLATAGDHPLKLVVEDNAGNLGETSKIIHINESPIANLAATPSTGPAPLSVSLDASASTDDGSLVYHFDFGDGQTLSGTNSVVSHLYQEGTFSASVKVVDKKGLESSKSIQIIAEQVIASNPPVANLTSDSVNPFSGDKVKFDASLSVPGDNPIVRFEINYGDGSSDSNTTGIFEHIYASAGTFSASLLVIDSKDQSGSKSLSIAVKALVSPTANLALDKSQIEAEQTLTVNASASTQGTRPIASYFYEFGDGQTLNTASSIVTHRFLSSYQGPIKVTVTDTAGLTSTAEAIIDVLPKKVAPIAALSVNPTLSLTGDQILFDASASTKGSSEIKEYRFNLGDGTTLIKTVPTLSYSYSVPGDYTVRLFVVDQNDLVSVDTKQIKIDPKPIIGPTASLVLDKTQAETSEVVTFTAAGSTKGEGTLQTYIFDFGDGETFTTQNASTTHFYAIAGSYSPKVTVIDSNFLRNEAISTVTIVNPVVVNPPRAFFSYDLTDGVITAFFEGRAGDYPLASAQYSTADGTIIPIEDLSYRSQFSTQLVQGDSFDVTLTVVDTQGNTDSFIHHVAVPLAGQEAFTPSYLDFEAFNVGSSKMVFDFRDSFDPIDMIEYFTFDYGDGTSETLDFTHAFSKHQYALPGSYSVKFTGKNFAGIERTVTKTVQVSDELLAVMPPIANFKALILDFAGHVSYYIDSSVAPSGDIASVHWDHGDGTTYTSPDPIHTHFYTPGVYQATLSIVDTNGMTDSQTQNVVVHTDGPPLVAQAACWSTGNTNEYSCQFFSLDKFKGINFIGLDWGDGTQESVPVINGEWQFTQRTHTFPSAGVYNVTMQISTSLGQTAQSVQTIDIIQNQAPVMAINCQQFNLNVTCDAFNSYDADGQIIKGLWDMGDGTLIPDAFTVNHTYQNPGNYTVKLIGWDQLGLKGEDTKLLTLIEGPNISPSASLSCTSPSINTISCNSLYSIDSDGSIVQYKYSFGDGSVLIKNTPDQIEHVYNYGGFKTIGIEVTDNKGATGFYEVSYQVQGNVPPVAAFSCSSLRPFEISCNGSGSSDLNDSIIAMDWSFSDGTFASGLNINKAFTSGGDKSVTLIVTDSFGITNSLTSTVSVLDNQAPIAQISCSSTKPQELVCNSTGSRDPNDSIVSYSWNLDGEVISGSGFSKVLASGGSKNVSLTVKDSFGKETVANQVVDVLINQAPIAVASCISNSILTVTCNAYQSYDSDGYIASYEWLYNGASIGTGSRLIYEFSENGPKEVTLKITDNLGQYKSSLSSFIVMENLPPIADFNFTEDETTSFLFSFDASRSMDTDGSITEFKWTFPNDEVLFGTKVSYQFLGNGTFPISLKVTDNFGFTSEKIYSVTVTKAPVGVITLSQSTGNIPYGITANASGSYDPDGGLITEYKWILPSGEILYGPEISFTMYRKGVRNLELIVTDSDGAKGISYAEINGQEKAIYFEYDSGNLSFPGYSFSAKPLEVMSQGNPYFSIVDGPVGATIDPATGVITWNIPSSFGEPSASFLVDMEEGGVNIQTDILVEIKKILNKRTIHLTDKLAKRVIVPTSSPDLGELIIEVPEDSFLGHDATFEVVELKNLLGDGSFTILSNSSFRWPLRMRIEQNGLVTERKSRDIFHKGVDLKAPFGTIKTVNQSNFCPSKTVDDIATYYNVLGNSWTGIGEYYIKRKEVIIGNGNSIEFTSNVDVLPYIEALRELNIGGLKVSLISEVDTSWARTLPSMPNVIFINSKRLNKYPFNIKSLIAHEYRHVEQLNNFGCLLNAANITKLKWITESYAEYIGEINSSELNNSLTTTLSNTKLTSMEIGEEFSLLLSGGLESKSPYHHFYFWDGFGHSDMQIIEEMLIRDNNKIISSGFEVIKDFFAENLVSLRSYLRSLAVRLNKGTGAGLIGKVRDLGYSFSSNQFLESRSYSLPKYSAVNLNLDPAKIPSEFMGESKILKFKILGNDPLQSSENGIFLQGVSESIDEKGELIYTLNLRDNNYQYKEITFVNLEDSSKSVEIQFGTFCNQDQQWFKKGGYCVYCPGYSLDAETGRCIWPKPTVSITCTSGAGKTSWDPFSGGEGNGWGSFYADITIVKTCTCPPGDRNCSSFSTEYIYQYKGQGRLLDGKIDWGNPYFGDDVRCSGSGGIAIDTCEISPSTP